MKIAYWFIFTPKNPTGFREMAGWPVAKGLRLGRTGVLECKCVTE